MKQISSRNLWRNKSWAIVKFAFIKKKLEPCCRQGYHQSRPVLLNQCTRCTKIGMGYTSTKKHTRAHDKLVTLKDHFITIKINFEISKPIIFCFLVLIDSFHFSEKKSPNFTKVILRRKLLIQRWPKCRLQLKNKHFS